MKHLLLIVLALILNNSLAQRTKRVVVDDYDLFARHEYYVLRKDKSVKHGRYTSVWVNGSPRQEGYYNYGKKDSLWVYYHLMKPIVNSRGLYKDGNKIGVWEYFDDKGKIMNRYDHSLNYLSYTNFVDTAKTHLYRLKDSLGFIDTLIQSKIDRPPIYLVGEQIIFQIIQNHIIYPQKAIGQNIYGTVRIGFFVTADGKAIDHEIIKGIGGGCDEEALRVVKLIPDEWSPAIHKGRIIEARVVIPITFQLN
ncbi:MAG: TonB family protein [Crocinitomicaceae bacterium]|nr:TonB family protein [Crocinitomicaceae bacterium]